MGAPTSVYMASTPPAQALASAERAARVASADPSIAAAWGEDGFTFGDLLDLINPLQHLPIISTLYRKLTGDEIAPAPRLLGGGLFGGPLGAASAAVGVAVEVATGKDIGEHVLAMFDGPQEAPTTAIAWATPRTGAVALGSEPPVSSTRLAQAEIVPPPSETAAQQVRPLGDGQTGLVPIEPLLAHVALTSDDVSFAPSVGSGNASEQLSAIELARMLALYHDNARKIQQTQLAIDSTL